MADETEVDDRTVRLETEVAELVHDVQALAALLGTMFGEPFRSKANEIVLKRQTPGAKEE